MASRPKGFGMTAELQRKKDAKYDPELELQARQWINALMGEEVLKESADQRDFHEKLRDGVILCKLIEKIEPSIAPKYNSSKMAFKMMENIGKFLTCCGKLGVPNTDSFQTVDLYESQNIPQVIDGLHALGRKVSATKPHLPTLGPKEASANIRNFTEEQLREGQSVIGLQMGTNQGASQSGMGAYGTGRQIDMA